MSGNGFNKTLARDFAPDMTIRDGHGRILDPFNNLISTLFTVARIRVISRRTLRNANIIRMRNVDTLKMLRREAIC